MGVKPSRALPPRPSGLCENCWRGPFAAHFGLFHSPIEWKWNGKRFLFVGGYTYLTSGLGRSYPAASSCAWCKFLCKLLAKALRSETIQRRPNGQWKITVGLCPINAGSPANAQVLGVVVNNVSRLYTGLVHTIISEFACFTPIDFDIDVLHQAIPQHHISSHEVLS